MTGFALLDVAIGVIFAILTFSLIASALQEALASVLNWRGRVLRRGIFRLLEGSTEHAQQLVNVTWLTPGRVKEAQLALEFLENPSIRSLYGPQNLFGRIWDWAVSKLRPSLRRPFETFGRMPSSIPRDTFARALIDTLVKDAEVTYRNIDVKDGITPEEIKQGIEDTEVLLSQWAKQADDVIRQAETAVRMLPMDDRTKQRLLGTLRDVSLSRALQRKLDTLGGAAAEIRSQIEQRIDQAQARIDAMSVELGKWFDTTMDRVTGWYVRRVKWLLFAIGLAMAATVNFDVIGYGDQLLNDEGLRQRIAAQAEAAVAAEAVGELTVQRTGNQQIAALALNTGRDGKITPEEFAAGQAKLPRTVREALGLNPDPDVQVTEQQATQALGTLNRTLADMPGAVVDANGDGVVSPEEEARAVDEYFDNLHKEIGISTQLLQEQFADRGVEMGWKCPGGGITFDCIGERINLQSVISWLAIGLGCTLGGQFWFDLLKSVLNVKAAASGLNSDVKQSTGASGGQAQGSAAARQAG